jgi:signal transduction histidine kinase
VGLRSLRAIGLAYLLMFAVLMTVVALGIYFVTNRALNSEFDARLRAESAAIGGAARPINIADATRRIHEREQRRDNGDLSYMLIDGEHRRLAGHLVMNLPAPGLSDVAFTDPVEGFDRGRALVLPTREGGWLVVVADSEPIEDVDRLLIRILLLGCGAAIVIGGSAGVALGRTVGRRISAISETADAIIAGDLRQRVPVDGSGSEFDRQATTLNRMLDRIEELMADMRHMSSDVAHDLRTPLGKLRNRLAAMVNAGEATVKRAQLEGALRLCDEILALFSAVLRIAEVDGGGRRARFAAVALHDVVRELASTFGPSIEEGGRSLMLGRADTVAAIGDRELIAQMLINLLENAAKYTPVTSIIRLELIAQGSDALITVSDTGRGIALGDRPTALRRFGRLEASRGGSGHGLGLALADSIARLHGGTITLAGDGTGLIVRILLPIGASR